MIESAGTKLVIIDGRDSRGYLESVRGTALTLLIDMEGAIHAASPSAMTLYGSVPGRLLREFMASSSLPAFSGALEDCLSTGETAPFTVEMLGLDGGRSTSIITLRKLQVPGKPVLVALDPPSLSLAGFCPTEASFIDTIFSSVPLPAVMIDPEGLIVRMNESAVSVAAAMLGADPLNTRFLDWVDPVDRDSVTATHRKRSEGGYAPSTYEVRLGIAGERSTPTEVTALLLPDGRDTLAFLVPSDGLPEAAQGHSSLVSGLLSTISAAGQGELRRMVLEFIRTGTGARGIAMTTPGRLATAGDVPMAASADAQEYLADTSQGESWRRTPEGLFDVTVTTRLRSGPCRISAFGIQSSKPSTLTRLVLGLAPMLADYLDSVEGLRTLTDTFTAILDTWNILTEEKGGLVGFLDTAAAVSGASRICLWGPAGADGNLPLLATTGAGTDPPPLNPQAETSGGWAYTHSETVYVADAVRDSRFTPLAPDSRSELSVPLLQGRRAHGVLCAVSTTPGAFGSPAPATLRLFAVVLSLWLLTKQSGTRLEARGREGGQGASDQEIDDILLSLGHRLRAPAAAIAGFAEMIEGGRMGRLDQGVTEAVASLARASGTLVDSTDRLLALVRTILRDDAGEPGWGRPEEVVESLSQSLGAKAASASLRLHTEVPGTGFTAMFDRSRLEEVILELADNAIRYTPPGGDVTLRIRQEGSAWTLEVEDTGKGIPSRTLPYIFDRFYHSADDGRSLGIGLTIVKRLVDGLDGTITVFSREGRGSRFVVRFPLEAT